MARRHGGSASIALLPRTTTNRFSVAIQPPLGRLVDNLPRTMSKLRIATTLAVLLLAPSLLHAAGDPLSRIAFGSCSNEKKDQPIWETIRRLDPQLFILAGDNVYADSADPAVLKESYDRLAAIPGFAALRASCPVIGTWDDHDYGKNDAGAEWEGKQAAKDAFMDFFGTPASSPLRERGGIHDAKVFGPEGRRVQVILLDTRWFRGPIKRMDDASFEKLRTEKGRWNGPYLPDPESDSTILGTDQWEWLAEQLAVPAEIRLIVSSIQVIPDQHGWEKWGNLPRERQRLLELIRQKAGGVIFLSGDRHTADISMLPAGAEDGPPYPLYDVTASALNQGGKSEEANRYRVGPEFPYGKPNFGWIEIDWAAEDPTIALEIRSLDGQAVRQAKTTLAALNPAGR